MRLRVRGADVNGGQWHGASSVVEPRETIDEKYWVLFGRNLHQMGVAGFFKAFSASNRH